MSADLLAGLLIGLVAALPYLAFAVAGIVALFRGRSRSVLPTIHIAGAALGAVAGGLAIAYALFFLMRWTGLNAEPSGWWWGFGLAVPALVVGWAGFLGTAQDHRKHRFGYLFAGVLLALLGFCGLPLGGVVFLAGLLFGRPS